VIWGAGGHALVVADILRQSSGYSVRGFLVDPLHGAATRREIASSVLGGWEELDALRKGGVAHALVARVRMAIGERLGAAGFSLATAIHPSAILAAGVQVGGGTVVAAGAIIGPGSAIGEHVIVNTAATIDHECAIAEGAHLSPGAHLSGRVSVGRGTWIGVGASVVDGVRIGADTVVGAGSVVLQDLPDGVTAYGVPARVQRENRDVL
jgi:acetyltransferase EpsM